MTSAPDAWAPAAAPPPWSAGADEHRLLADGALALGVAPEAWPLVHPWMPLDPSPQPAAGQPRARIDVQVGPRAFARPADPPMLVLHAVTCWRVADGGVRLASDDDRVSAEIDAATLRATVRLPPDGDADDAPLVFNADVALTVAAAFLLGRLGRTLVHAGAVVEPGGTAWLLVGGTFSGKTTTCINLIRAGWPFLTDDHAILSRAGGRVWAEGWLRPFNLDRGFVHGTSEGVRARVPPDGFGPGPWRRTAPVGGVLFPRVEADLPTAVDPLHPAEALGRLLDQSPWLVGDRATAVDVLSVLRQAASLPALQLRLGGDTYRDPARLAALLAAATGGRGDPSA